MKILEFGNITNKAICKILFILGSLMSLVSSGAIGYIVCMNTEYNKMVQTVEGMYTGIYVPNAPLGFLVGIVVFVLSVGLCRILSEILFIILEFFKSNTK